MKKLPLKSYLISLSLVLLLPSCAGSGIPKVSTYGEAERESASKVEPLPTRIENEPGFKLGKAEPLPKGTRIAKPDAGVSKTLNEARALVDKDRLAYMKRLQARRERLRKDLATERKHAQVNRQVYESTIKNLEARMEKQHSWWNENKGLMGLAVGVAIGMAITVGIVYALTKGQGASTTTTTSNVKVPDQGIRF
jgi:small-conductance mechanosensitive channel